MVNEKAVLLLLANSAVLTQAEILVQPGMPTSATILSLRALVGKGQVEAVGLRSFRITSKGRRRLFPLQAAVRPRVAAVLAQLLAEPAGKEVDALLEEMHEPTTDAQLEHVLTAMTGREWVCTARKGDRTVYHLTDLGRAEAMKPRMRERNAHRNR